MLQPCAPGDVPEAGAHEQYEDGPPGLVCWSWLLTQFLLAGPVRRKAWEKQACVGSCF